jgi:hypothetical protein
MGERCRRGFVLVLLCVGTAVSAPLPALARPAPGVTHREFTTGAGLAADVVEVDLTRPGARLALLTPGVLTARAPVATLADRAGATAAINGDFFDIDGTGAPTGAAVSGGRPLKSAEPLGRRQAPQAPGAGPEHVLAVGEDGVVRVDRLSLAAEARGPRGPLRVRALNQLAVPADGIGIVNSDWGDMDRGRTLCGSDTDPAAPCAADRWELRLRAGRVVAAGTPGGGRLAPDELALVGRDQGAATLRDVRVGESVQVSYALTASSGVATQEAVGATPVLRDGQPVDGLGSTGRASRSAVGLSADGRHVRLVTVDGNEETDAGPTLAELAAILRDMGSDDAVNLDGGGSSTLVFRAPGAPAASIVNSPSGSAPRAVPNGLGILTGPSNGT